MKKRFTEEQIIQVLKEHAAGAKVAELCRRHGISQNGYQGYPVFAPPSTELAPKNWTGS